MLLAIDIGNTNLVIGCFQDNELKFKARIATDTARTSDQYGVEIKNMMEAYGVRAPIIRYQKIGRSVSHPARSAIAIF